ncbi:MAG: hypothetical protein JNL60_05190, partial [Bacteroidia bacterium]|nr:hypothetical protein [Bacteroidia bacterium]
MEDGTKNNQDFKGEGKFHLPGDYFEKSAQSIVNKIEWEEEHKPYPQLLKWRNKHGFCLPDGYFKGKEARLEQIEFPFLKDLAANPGFSVPGEYFEAAEFQTYEQFKAEEQDELSSFRTLSSIPKRNSFYLPQEYFVSNEAHVNALLASEPKTKIISLFRKGFAYSAAAILLVVISLWVYNYYFKPIEVKDCGTIACVDR